MHPAEHQEQHDRDQRQRQHLHAFLVGGDGPGQRAGDRLQAGELNLAVVEFLEIGLDGLVVGQDRVVVVALERDADEGVLAVLAGHPLDDGIGAGRRRQPAGPADHLVGVILLEGVEFVDDLLLPRRIVDRLRRGERRHDVAGSVTSVGLVTEHRCLDRLATVVVETTLRDVLAQADPENAAEQAQCHRHADYDEPVAIYSSTPPGEHVSSLLDLRRPAHWF